MYFLQGSLPLLRILLVDDPVEDRLLLADFCVNKCYRLYVVEFLLDVLYALRWFTTLVAA